MGEPGRELPAVVGAVGGAQPQIERGVAAVVHEPVRPSASRTRRAPFGVARALHVDVRVVVERGGGRGLHRRRAP